MGTAEATALAGKMVGEYPLTLAVLLRQIEDGENRTPARVKEACTTLALRCFWEGDAAVAADPAISHLLSRVTEPTAAARDLDQIMDEARTARRGLGAFAASGNSYKGS